ncbi:MAG: OsmC family protein [Syntrophobacteraceae bacterium]|nr:OsmC family protein [Syntrophobacteraceae bacterium]
MSENEAQKQDKLAPIKVLATITAGPNRRIIARARDHEIVMDVSKVRGGEDAGATPPELLAMALGGCILNICRVMAMQKGIVLEDLSVSISGEVDPTRAFGIPTQTRAGFSHLLAQIECSALSEAEKEEFVRELRQRCPLCDTVANPTPLEVIFAR